MSKTQSARFNVAKLAPVLEDLHDRLAGVVIERLHWSDFLRRYDRPGMLFYLDPPYWGSETDYGNAFDRDQFAAMAEALGSLQGRFLVSINDRPETRELFGRFQVEGAGLRYSISKGRQTEARELIVEGP